MLRTATMTLTGGSDSMATLAAAGGLQAGSLNVGIRQMWLYNPASNSAATIGRSNVATVGFPLPNQAAPFVIGPFEGNAPTNLSEWYIKGTVGNVVTLMIVTN
jgi:hypothetical protein